MPEDIERPRDLQEKLNKEIKKMLKEANREMDKKNYEKALVIYFDIQELNDEIPVVWMDKGTAFLNMGHPDTAIQNFDKALSLNPVPITKVTTLMLKAIALGAQKKWKEARIYLQKGMKYAKRTHDREIIELAEGKLKYFKGEFGEDKA